MDTPGHAKHHHCIWDEASRGWFTGDTFGIAYPELHTPQGPYVVPATAPVQFDQEALHVSVARLLNDKPTFMYLTHYGAVAEPEQLSVQFLSQVDAMAEAARSLAGASDRHEKLKRAFADIYLHELRRCGSTLPEYFLRELLATDIELNAQGLGAWLNKQNSASASES
jgi:glyoxylase-like metal-dependent hydrolase (beta-lactamase superfamily II)